MYRYRMSGKPLAWCQILPYLVAALVVASVGVLIFWLVYNEPKVQNFMEEATHYNTVDAYIPE